MTRTEILEKLAHGEITVDEATRLLQALNDEKPTGEATGKADAAPKAEKEDAEPAEAAQADGEADFREKGGKTGRFLHIRVGRAGKDFVKINIPLAVARAGVNASTRFSRHWPHHPWREMMEAIQRGEVGNLLEVESEDDDGHVRIYVD